MTLRVPRDIGEGRAATIRTTRVQTVTSSADVLDAVTP
jgi:hypothetical protein